MNKTLDVDILSLIRKHRQRINALGVSRLGLFGSFARGEQTSESDIDFIVEFQSGKKTFDNFIGLSFLLEDLAGRRVELITPQSLTPSFAKRIQAETEYVDLSN